MPKIDIIEPESGSVFVNRDYEAALRHAGLISVEALLSARGEAVKKVLKERGTERIILKNPSGGPDIETYLKRFSPPPLKERLKSALNLKFKTFGALDEWRALVFFAENDLSAPIPVAAAKTASGSCVLSLAIKDYTRASDLFPKLKNDFSRRRALIKKIALFAAKMHRLGAAHQDFYLVHFFVREKDSDAVSLIDLQRVVFESPLGARRIVKDIGQLLFSAEGLVSRADTAFFWSVYRGERGRPAPRDLSLIKRITAKAARIGRHTAKMYNAKLLKRGAQDF
jgi:hypothetical protein